MLNKQYFAASAVLMIIMMNVLSGTIIGVALPSLAIEFGVTDSAVTWLVNALQMIVPMTMLSFSAIGDRWGYRKVFIFGTLLFVIASLLCGLSTNFETLVVARVLQGIGCACGLSVNTALLRLIFPPKIFGRAMSVNAIVVAVSSASGPTIAGLLLKHLTWPWLFFFNLPFGIISLLLAFFLLPHNAKIERKEPFDWYGAVLNALFFGLLLYCIEVYAHGNNILLALLLFAACVGIGILFYRRETKREMPIFPIDLMKIPMFSLSVGTSICSYAAQSLALVSLPFFMYHVLHFNPVMIGMMLTPWPLANVLTAPLSARLIEKYPAGMVCTIGMCTFAFGFLMLILLPDNPSSLNIVWRMALCGIGFGMFQVPNNVTMISSAPQQRSGSASGMLGTARVIGQTIGTTLVALFFRLFGDAEKAQACLMLAIVMALFAAVVSFQRVKKPSVNA